MAESSATVAVTCKLPNGIVMQLQREKEIAEPTQTSPDRRVKIHEYYGDKYVLKGFANGKSDPDVTVIGNFAINRGIPADFAEKWFDQQAEHPAVVAEMVYPHRSVNVANGWANEHAAMLSGFEPADPNALPDEFKRNVETAEV